MRIALIAPPFRGSARGLPLGLAHLAAVLERDHHQVHVLDMTVERNSRAALTTFLEQSQPDVVGISVVCATYLDAVEVADTSRRSLGEEAKIIVGGPHVTFGAEVVLRSRHCIDICVLGEAEHTMVELCRALKDKNSRDWMRVPGIAFRDGEQVRFSGPRLLMPELDQLPFPARCYFPESAYADAVGVFEVGSTNKAELIASRGCPYPCGFCSTKEFWQRKYRNRSPQHVVAELALLRGMGRTDVYFNDDIFTVRRDWVVQLCNLLIETKTDIRWACGTRVDRVDFDLLKLMRDAGCVYIYYGVETGSDYLNGLQKKGASIAKVERAYSLLRDVGIYSSAALIFGLPGETWETARDTVNWIRDVVRPDETWISKATCYPGTELAERFEITAEDYEIREDGKCRKGLPYGTGGIYTPFFDDTQLVSRIWNYARAELLDLKIDFGDDHGLSTVSKSP